MADGIFFNAFSSLPPSLPLLSFSLPKKNTCKSLVLLLLSVSRLEVKGREEGYEAEEEECGG